MSYNLNAQNSIDSQKKADNLYHASKYQEAIEEYQILFSKIDTTLCEEWWLTSLHNWGMAQLFKGKNTGLKQMEKATSCARELESNELCATLLINQSVFYKLTNDLSAAKDALLKALTLSSLSEQTKGNIYAQLALNTRQLRNDTCSIYANKAIDIGIAIKDTNILIAAYMGISIHEKYNRNFHKALEHSQNSLQFQTGKYEFKRSQTFLNIAGLFLELNDFNFGRIYLDSALHYIDQSIFYAYTGQVNFLEAKIYSHEKKYTKALAKYQESLKRNKSSFLRMQCYINMARIEAEIGNTTKEDEYTNEAFTLCENASHSKFKNYCYLLNSQEAFKKGNYYNSLNISNKLAKQENIDLSPNSIPQISLLQAKNYEKLGEIKKSLNKYKQHFELKDSLESMINTQLIYSLENKFKNAKQDNQLAQLKSKGELQSLKLQQQRWGGLAIAAFLFLFSGSFISLARQNKKINNQNQTISEAVSDKNILLKEIHHRVKNNLQVISSLFKLQSRHVTDEAALIALQEGRNRVNSMAILHQNLYQEDNLKGIEMVSYIDQLCDSILQSNNRQKQDLFFENKIDPMTLDIDTVIPMGLILTEFIARSMSLDFESVLDKSICVNLKEENQILTLEVIDHGRKRKDQNLLNKSFSEKIIASFSKKLKADYQYNYGKQNQAILNISKYKKA